MIFSVGHQLLNFLFSTPGASCKFFSPRTCCSVWKRPFTFPDQIEFVGHGVCANGNMPAKLENNLLKTWLNFRFVCNIASFVGFMLFYGPYTPYAELHMPKLREVMKLTYKYQVDEIVTQEPYKERYESIHPLFADQCVACYDSDLHCYSQMGFSSFGFGYSLYQPNCDEVLLAVMYCEIMSGNCGFMTPGFTAQLRSISFGSRCTSSHEDKHYSHLGEEFCSDWIFSRIYSEVLVRTFYWL